MAPFISLCPPNGRLLDVVDLFERRLKAALEEAKNHIGIYEEFTEDLMKHYPEQLQEWRTTIRAYESRVPRMKSPYEVEGESMIQFSFLVRDRQTNVFNWVDITLALVTRRQAEEEAEQVRLQHNIIPGRSAFLLEGIAIENVQ